MNDDVKDWLRIIGGGILLIALVVAIPLSVMNRTQELCSEKFGSGWNARYVHYGPSMCVNDKGEVKYP